MSMTSEKSFQETFVTTDGSQEKFGGKGKGLIELTKIPEIEVPPFTIIPADMNESDRRKLIDDFVNQYLSDGRPVAVRSSAIVEDGEKSSYAGAFETYLNVDASVDQIDEKVVNITTQAQEKLNTVFNVSDQDAAGVGVVVQQMVTPDYAGVCLSSAHHESDDPYLMVNFTPGLGDDLVSGQTNGTELRCLRKHNLNDETVNKYPFIADLIRTMVDIEDHFDRAMDVEFAYEDGRLYILQARPQTTNPSFDPAQIHSLSDDLTDTISAVSKEIDEYQDDILADMCDINPRELLGDRAHPLNLEIFRDIFADHIVEEARSELGYAPLHQGLLRTVSNKPYISVRTSAYSMRPKGIKRKTYDKIVNHYFEQILDKPELQDRIEFGVFVTNGAQAEALVNELSGQLSQGEQAEILHAFNALERNLEKQAKEFGENTGQFLDEYDHQIEQSKSQGVKNVMSALKSGTKRFTKVARLAFYMKAKMDHMYGEDFTENAMQGIHTPSTDLQRDLEKFAQGDLNKDVIVSKYGHLRPGQMDVFAKAYRNDPETFFNFDYYSNLEPSELDLAKQNRKNQTAQFNDFFKSLDPHIQEEVIVLRQLFEGRERIKHTFMKAFDSVAQYASNDGQLYDDNRLDCVSQNASNQQLMLPSVIHGQTDLACLETPSNIGTFITDQTVQATACIINQDNMNTISRSDVKGRIIVLDKADPGFDFLFQYDPAGVITKIGGPASHVAIRVSEYGIPACIGSGIDVNSVENNQLLTLNCKDKSITNISAQKTPEKQQGINDNATNASQSSGPAL